MNESRFSVDGKTVIVTGASRGIGRAVADGFVEAGANVAFVARSDSILDVATAETANRVLGLQCDVAEPGAAERACRETVERFGGIDILINNAGVTLPGEDSYSDTVWDRTLDVNLKAAFQFSRAAAAVMQDANRGGSIINIASIGAMLGFPDNPSYQAAKGGLRQLTKALARDWGAIGIRVNVICPGYIRTEMTAASYADPQLQSDRTERTMLARWGEPDDLVGPCLFLASDASAYITGCELPVDGGWTAKGL